jgi:cyclopropane fatty-acyl-phospholipid synthase-like methyltransferase
VSDHTIPAAFYDEAYFTGETSNYRDGYSWDRFGALFQALALTLVQSFPTAHSFLDIGCARGFLVRALREQHVMAWGMDHSQYAIDHADPLAAPYLSCQAIEDAYMPGVDVIIACETLEHLTVAQLEQALVFLQRRTQIGLVATVPMPSMHNRLAWHEAQQEVTHVTLEDREWWHALLRRTGWRVDAFTCLVERYFVNHPLFRAAAWNPLCASVMR